MKFSNDNSAWESLSHKQKNQALLEQQKQLLKTFLEKRAISPEQYEKSLRDLTEKMNL